MTVAGMRSTPSEDGRSYAHRPKDLGVSRVAFAAHRHKEKQILERAIAQLSASVPKSLPELIGLGRTITRRADDILALFAPTPNGRAEAINGCLECLRSTALGLTNYITRGLLESRGFRLLQHPRARLAT